MKSLLRRLRARGLPGAAGEQLACRHLESAGYRIVERNWRCRSGEVDVIARDGDVTVFVEVKERYGRSHGEGCDAVTFGKRRRVVRAARLYAAAHGLSESPLRFDVVAIDHDSAGAHIRHERGAFGEDD